MTETLNQHTMDSSKFDLDTYWRLPDRSGWFIRKLRDRLEAAGFRRLYGKTQEDLARLNNMLDRGLLSYHQLTESELVRLAQEQLPHESELETYSPWLLTLLLGREEDRFGKFDKFLDLPAELRNRVYEEHLNGFDEVLDCPAQPPLACANRRLRAEALPLFHSMKIFSFRGLIKDFGLKTNARGWSLSLPPMAYAFVASLCTKYTSKMGGIEISVWAPKTTDEPEELMTGYRLRRDGEEGYKGESFWTDKESEVKKWIPGCPASILEAFEEALVLDPGKEKLQPSDIFAMRSAIEKTLFF